MFRSEFAPDALAAGLATAEKFGSARQFVLGIQADAEAELANVKVAAESGNEYAAQFCPARAAECYTALAWAALALGLYSECPAVYGACDRSPEGTCYHCGGNPRRDQFTVLNPI